MTKKTRKYAFASAIIAVSLISFGTANAIEGQNAPELASPPTNGKTTSIKSKASAFEQEVQARKSEMDKAKEAQKSPSSAAAKNLRQETKEIKADIKNLKQDVKDIRNAVAEKRAEKIPQAKQNIMASIRTLANTISKLQDVSKRTATRITKISATGADTTAVSALLEQANAQLAIASNDIVSAQNAINAVTNSAAATATSSIKVKMAIQAIYVPSKTAVAKVQSDIQTAQKTLYDIINALKVLETKKPADSASSTPAVQN